MKLPAKETPEEEKFGELPKFTTAEFLGEILLASNAVRLLAQISGAFLPLWTG